MTPTVCSFIYLYMYMYVYGNYIYEDIYDIFHKERIDPIS